MTQTHAKGMAIAVIDHGKVGYTHAYGIRNAKGDSLTTATHGLSAVSDSLTARGVGQWLHARNRLLAGARPIEALAEGRSQDVRLAAQAFVDGSYV